MTLYFETFGKSTIVSAQWLSDDLKIHVVEILASQVEIYPFQ